MSRTPSRSMDWYIGERDDGSEIWEKFLVPMIDEIYDCSPESIAPIPLERGFVRCQIGKCRKSIRKGDYDRHRRATHAVNVEELKTPCTWPKCTYRAAQLSCLATHMRTRHFRVPYKRCRICVDRDNVGFSDPSLHTKHMKVFHPEVPRQSPEHQQPTRTKAEKEKRGIRLVALQDADAQSTDAASEYDSPSDGSSTTTGNKRRRPPLDPLTVGYCHQEYESDSIASSSSVSSSSLSLATAQPFSYYSPLSSSSSLYSSPSPLASLSLLPPSPTLSHRLSLPAAIVLPCGCTTQRGRESMSIRHLLTESPSNAHRCPQAKRRRVC